MMEWNHIVPGLKEATALALNEYNWTPVRTLLELTLPKDSVEYTQLQQIHVNDNIIKEACTKGFTELVSIFLNNGLQANCMVDKLSKRRMLSLAASNGCVSLVKLLLNSGADINCMMCSGKTPLFWAVQEGHLEVVRHLISAGADINTCSKDGKTLLDAAYFYNTFQEEMLHLLLDSGCDLNKYNYSCSPLYWAVSGYKLNLVQMLLEAGAHVNGRDLPLHQAVRHGNIPVIQLLLNYGADINAKNLHGDTALYSAVVNGKLQSVEFLIKHGSLINYINNFQQTPLSLSIQYKQFDVAMLLINSGADLNLVIHHTLLHRAIYKGAPIHVIECLLEHGANVSTVCNNKTALERIIFYSHHSNNRKLKIAKLLLIYGSNHYVDDDHGNTVLHWACRIGDMGLVEYLIYYGLDVEAKNTEGKKPYDIATEKGHTNIAKAIIHYHCNKYTKF